VNPIRLVLDVTAACAYPSADVGETITQVEENGGMFTVPLPCLVAARTNTDRHNLELLVGHRAFQPADLSYDQWRQLSAMADVLDDELAAAALPLARRGPTTATSPHPEAPRGVPR
jgi:hypothetical protein